MNNQNTYQGAYAGFALNKQCLLPSTSKISLTQEQEPQESTMKRKLPMQNNYFNQQPSPGDERYEIISEDNNIYPKPKRIRTEFTAIQLMELESEFLKDKYLRQPRRFQIAMRLNLTETNVKVWFQNRRMKEKRLPTHTEQETLVEKLEFVGQEFHQHAPPLPILKPTSAQLVTSLEDLSAKVSPILRPADKPFIPQIMVQVPVNRTVARNPPQSRIQNATNFSVDSTTFQDQPHHQIQNTISVTAPMWRGQSNNTPSQQYQQNYSINQPNQPQYQQLQEQPQQQIHTQQMHQLNRQILQKTLPQTKLIQIYPIQDEKSLPAHSCHEVRQPAEIHQQFVQQMQQQQMNQPNQQLLQKTLPQNGLIQINPIQNEKSLPAHNSHQVGQPVEIHQQQMHQPNQQLLQKTLPQNGLIQINPIQDEKSLPPHNVRQPVEIHQQFVHQMQQQQMHQPNQQLLQKTLPQNGLIQINPIQDEKSLPPHNCHQVGQPVEIHQQFDQQQMHQPNQQLLQKTLPQPRLIQIYPIPDEKSLPEHSHQVRQPVEIHQQIDQQQMHQPNQQLSQKTLPQPRLIRIYPIEDEKSLPEHSHQVRQPVKVTTFPDKLEDFLNKPQVQFPVEEQVAFEGTGEQLSSALELEQSSNVDQSSNFVDSSTFFDSEIPSHVYNPHLNDLIGTNSLIQPEVERQRLSDLCYFVNGQPCFGNVCPELPSDSGPSVEDNIIAPNPMSEDRFEQPCFGNVCPELPSDFGPFVQDNIIATNPMSQDRFEQPCFGNVCPELPSDFGPSVQDNVIAPNPMSQDRFEQPCFGNVCPALPSDTGPSVEDNIIAPNPMSEDRFEQPCSGNVCPALPSDSGPSVEANITAPELMSEDLNVDINDLLNIQPQPTISQDELDLDPDLDFLEIPPKPLPPKPLPPKSPPNPEPIIGALNFSFENCFGPNATSNEPTITVNTNFNLF